MRRYFFILLAGIALGMAGCKHATVFKEIQVPGKFTMQVPVYLHAASDLYSDASPTLQYESDSAMVYMLVFDTARENLNEKSLKDYYDAIVGKPDGNGTHITPPRPAMIKGDTALVSEMSAVQNNIPVFYRIEVIATPSRFYYILLWCRADKKNKMKGDFDKVLDSFTDIYHNKV